METRSAPSIAGTFAGAARDHRTAAAIAASSAALVVMTAVLSPVRDDIGLLNVALILLLVPVVTSALAGWLPGLVAALAANLSFNLFFVPPLHTVTVQEPRNVLALFLFLAVSSVSALLFEVARRRTALARSRQAETEALYGVAAALIASPDPVRAIDEARLRMQQALGLKAIGVYMGRSADDLRLVSGLDDPDSSPDRRAIISQAMASGEVVSTGGGLYGERRRVGRTREARPRIFARLAVGQVLVGLIEAHGRVSTTATVRPDWLLQAMAEQIALGVQRLQLADEQRRADRLEAVSSFKTALLSSLSHDLRTPLASIKTSVTGLLNPDLSWSEEDRREMLEGVDQETDRLTRMLTGLLDLTRIESGALQPQRDWHLLSELIGDAVATVSAHDKERRIQASVDEQALGYFDFAQMRSALVNLLENALKYSPSPSPVEVSALSEPAGLTFQVCDHGPGIARRDRARIFEKFYRSPATVEGVRGTGVGLAIVRGIVEAHGGRVAVEDREGGGAVFTIRLPQPPVPAAAGAAIGHP
jgi:two-component system sensor histidine kinase KdpD